MINNNSLTLKIIAYFFALVLFAGGCSKKSDLSSLSPSEIVDLCRAAAGEEDYELLRQIVYFPPNTSEDEINKRIGISRDPAHKAGAEDAKTLMGILGAKIVSKYEKVLDENTAEVGIGIRIGVGPAGKFIPTDQMVLKKDKNIWKIDYSRNQLTRDRLIEAIKKNPEIAWPYYYMGMNLQAENPYRAYKFYKKYYTLEPEGFFVSEEHLMSILNRFENVEKEEQEQVRLIETIPENGDGRLSRYLHLCQLFTETGDYTKAKMYLTKAEDFIKKKSKLDPYLKANYEKTKETLEYRIEAKTDDPLDKLLE